MKQNSKSWSLLCVGLTLAFLLLFGSVTAIIDPYFHYHGPLRELSYPLNNQRYQNDGIVQHFDYDALITGTSLTENFKTSEFDALFGTKAIKVSYSGGTFAEIFSNLEKAMQSNPNIKTVLFGIDEWFLASGRDLIQADGSYPTYLYDENLFNDVEYVLNKEIFCSSTLEVLLHTKKGLPTTSFDEYSSWAFVYDAENVITNYARPELAEEVPLTEEDVVRLNDTLKNTLVKLAQEHPHTQFIFYYPPYSILNWDHNGRLGIQQRYLQLYELSSEILLEEENVQLFSFHTDFELITNLDNYKDIVHHSNDVNSLLLQRFRNGEYRLTKENYQQHWQEVTNFYTNFDYEAFLLG